MKVGLPFAYNCVGCFDAVACPVCGEHIVEDGNPLDSSAYAAHFEKHHTEDQPQRYTDTPRRGTRCG